MRRRCRRRSWRGCRRNSPAGSRCCSARKARPDLRIAARSSESVHRRVVCFVCPLLSSATPPSAPPTNPPPPPGGTGPGQGRTGLPVPWEGCVPPRARARRPAPCSDSDRPSARAARLPHPPERASSAAVTRTSPPGPDAVRPGALAGGGGRGAGASACRGSERGPPSHPGPRAGTALRAAELRKSPGRRRGALNRCARRQRPLDGRAAVRRVRSAA